jgi:hypothetical protein
LFKNHIKENRRGLPFILTVSPHRITTVELLLSVGTHLRVLDDGGKGIKEIHWIFRFLESENPYLNWNKYELLRSIISFNSGNCILF